MIKSFKPIVSQKPYVLILGTMPGIESINKNQYYAHKRNLFWKLLFEIFNTSLSDEYEDRKKLIINNNLALWDILKYCDRVGSLDSNIKNESVNDIIQFLNKYPLIEKIVFNGQGAFKFFKKHIRNSINKDIDYICMPSTSPANAGITFNEKIDRWGELSYLCRKKSYKINMESIIGNITLKSDGISLTEILIGKKETENLNKNIEVLEQAKMELYEYFSGKRKAFTVKIKPLGTDFQKRVWKELEKIPYGKTSSYLNIANNLQNTSARAIGQANKNNPLPIIIPCHRVIGANNKVTGYMGIKNNPLQKLLIELEKEHEF